MKIAIAGPGRSGTSLLVALLKEWGFLAVDAPMLEHANAGLESRIGLDNGLEIHKDPWLYEYIDEINPVILDTFDAFLIPIRELKSVAVSRMVQERFARAIHFDNAEWSYKTWGSVPGGALYETTVEAVEQVSEFGLWKVVETLAERGIQPLFLHFPRFATDFDYLWDQIGHLLQTRISKQLAKDIFNRVVEPEKIRVTPELQKSHLEVAELQGLVTELRKETRALMAKNDQLAHETENLRWQAQQAEALKIQVQELEDMKQQLDQAEALRLQLQEIKESKVWRYTKFLRKDH